MRLLSVAGTRLSWYCLVSGLLLAGAAGCGSRVATSPVDMARRHLQLNRPQLAVDALAKEDSAEGHYLKAVALQALGQNAAARDQIGEALTIDAHEPKYLGYEAVLDLNARKGEAAQPLIELYEQHPSSAALSYFVLRAYVAKGDIKSTLRTFKLSLTLIDEIPEFMFSALQLAISTEQSDICKELLTKLERAAPKDAEFLRELMNVAVRAQQPERAEHLLKQITALTPDAPDLQELQVKMELLLGRNEAALSAAREAVKKTPDELSTQMLLAEALLRADARPERERELAELAAKHPDEADFLRRYALYLVKIGKIPEAVNLINQRLAQTKSPAVRARLLSLAIRIPVEAADTALSEKQLALHRAQFSNPLVAEYFAGRIQYMKGDLPGALKRFQAVTTSPNIGQTEADQLIAAESLAWQRRILDSQHAQERLKNAQEDLNKLLQEGKRKPPPASSRPAPVKPATK